MKKVLFPILAVVLALSLALPMAAVVGASPTTVTFDSGFSAGDSVEGLGTADTNLEITSTGDALVIVEEDNNTYLAYSGNATSQNDTPNGGLPGGFGFGDVDRDDELGFEVTFNGNTVSSFSIDMFDYGDWFNQMDNYSGTKTHTAKLVAYDYTTGEIDSDTLTFTSTGGGSTGRTMTTLNSVDIADKPLSSAGDALEAVAGDPGLWSFSVSGTGIFKVVMEFDGNNSIDPGVAWDNIDFEIEEYIEVDKDYRYTNVGFEKDNDGDGLFSEDPIDFDAENNPIDNDGDGLFNEDPVDYPLGTSLGYRLPKDTSSNYHLEAVIHPKNNKVKSYNPGQYYAVSTVNVLVDVDTLTIFEDWDDCKEISVLNPKNGGGGSVVIVQVGPNDPNNVAYQILDATSEDVTITGNTAKAVLGPVSAGTTILMYVKFGPGLKGEVWGGPYGPCINYNAASTAEVPSDITDWAAAGEDWIVANANLIVVAQD